MSNDPKLITLGVIYHAYFAHTRFVAVGKENASDPQRNAEVDCQPWVCREKGVHAAEVVNRCLATTIDGMAGRVTASLSLKHADLSGRHVRRHVTHLVRVR